MDDLNKRITKVSRQIEQLTKQREKDIARKYARVLVTIRAEMAKQYEKYEKDGKLSLQEMLKYDRLKKLNQRVSFLMQAHYKDIYSQIGDTISKTYTEGYYQTAYNLEMHIKKKIGYRAVRPETLKAMLDNPVAGLTLKRTLQQRRAYIIQQIQRQITLGLQNNESYASMAKRLKGELEGDAVKAMRIVRTEGHRVQESAKHDAMDFANSNGVVMHKQWNSLEDERVRGKKGIANHRKLNNKKIAMDQLFDDGLSKGPAPGQLPAAASSINCRCFLTYSIEKVVKKDLKDIEQTTFEQWKKENIKEVELPKETKPTEKAKTTTKKTKTPTIQETAQEWANKNLKMKVDYKGIPDDLANDLNKAIERLQNRYPETVKSEWTGLGQITVSELPQGTYGQAMGRGIIQLSANYFKDKKKLLEDMKVNVNRGWYPEGTDTTTSVLTHEYGHIIDNFLKENYKSVWEQKVNKPILRLMEKEKNNIKTGVSTYATYNREELLAEAFSEYMENKKPREIAKKIGKMIDSAFKEIRKGVQ